MRSYIRLYGPPALKAIKALEKLAIGIPQVCIMDTMLGVEPFEDQQDIYDYFVSMEAPISEERCTSIISRSGEMLGDYDFFFEWYSKPKRAEIDDLMREIDEVLEPLGCRYRMTIGK